MPPVAPLLNLLNRTDLACELQITSAYSDPDGHAHTSTQWQIDLQSGNFSAPKYNNISTVYKLRRWISSLPRNTALKARARFINSIGGQGAWSNEVSFSTKNLLIAINFPFVAKNQTNDPNFRGTYGSITGSNVANFTNTLPPELPVDLRLEGVKSVPDDRAARFNMSRVDGSYNQDTGGQPKNILRVTSPVDAPKFTVMVVLRDLGIALGQNLGISLVLGEICGVPQNWFIYENNGNAHIVFNADGGNKSKAIGTITTLDSEVSVLCCSYEPPIYTRGACACVPAPAPTDYIMTQGPRVRYLNAAGAVVTDASSWGDVMDICNCNPNGAVFYRLRPIERVASPSAFFDIGHGSSNVSGGDDPQADGAFFKGLISEVAYWPNIVLTDSQMTAIYQAVRVGGTKLIDVIRGFPSDNWPLFAFRLSEVERPDKPRVTVRL